MESLLSGSLPDLRGVSWESSRSDDREFKIWTSGGSRHRRFSHPNMSHSNLISDIQSLTLLPLSKPTSSSPSTSNTRPLFCGLVCLTLSFSCFDLLGPSILFLDSATSSLLLSSAFLGAMILTSSTANLLTPQNGAVLLIPFLLTHFAPSILHLLPAYAILLGSILSATFHSSIDSFHFVTPLGIGSGLSGPLVWLSKELPSLHHSSSSLKIPPSNATLDPLLPWWSAHLPLRLSFDEFSVLFTLLLIVSSFGGLILCLGRPVKIGRCGHGKLSESLRKKSSKERNSCWMSLRLLFLACSAGIQRALVSQTFLKELLLIKFGIPRTCLAVSLFGASLAFNAWLLKNIIKYFSWSIVICITSVFQYFLLYVIWNQLMNGEKDEDVHSYLACASVWGSVSAVLEVALIEFTLELADSSDRSLFRNVNTVRFLAASLTYSCRIFVSEQQKVLVTGAIYTIFIAFFIGSKSKGKIPASEEQPNKSCQLFTNSAPC